MPASSLNINLPFKAAQENQIVLGDLAAVYNIRNKRLAFAVYGDIGPAQKIGEGSVAIARQLDVPTDHLIGVQDGIAHVVFPWQSPHRTTDERPNYP